MKNSELHKISLQKLKELVIEQIKRELSEKETKDNLITKNNPFELCRRIEVESYMDSKTIKYIVPTGKGADLEITDGFDNVPLEHLSVEELISIQDVLEDT